MNQGYSSRGEMGPEVTAAATFVSRLLRTRGFLSEHQLHDFRDCLQQSLSGNLVGFSCNKKKTFGYELVIVEMAA